MKLFSVVYRGHEFTAINSSSHVLLCVRLVFFNSTYFHAGVHVRCTPSGHKADRVFRAGGRSILIPDEIGKFLIPSVRDGHTRRHTYFNIY